MNGSDEAVIPVLDAAGALHGIVLAGDLAWHAAHDPLAAIGSFARPVPAALTSSETLERAADLMTDPAVPLLPIVEAGSGKLIAIVTRRDVLAAYRSLVQSDRVTVQGTDALGDAVAGRFR